MNKKNFFKIIFNLILIFTSIFFILKKIFNIKTINTQRQKNYRDKKTTEKQMKKQK